MISIRPISYSGTLVLLLASTTTIFPRTALTSPLDIARIPADTKWLVHMDMDAMRESGWGQYIRSKWLSRERVREHIDKMIEKTGLDPREDLRSATLFDNGFEKHRGTVLIEVQNVDGQKLLALLRERHPDLRVSSYGEHRLYLWKSDHGRKKDHYITGCLYQGSIMVFSSETPNVMVALDVLDGKAAAISASSPLAMAAEDGTLLLARGIEMAELGWPGRCPVLSDSDQFSFAAGEADGKVFADSKLVTNKEETATNAVAVMNGLRAMIMLRHREHEHVMRVLEGLTSTVDGTNLSIRWEANGKDVLKSAGILKEFHKHKKLYRDKRRRMRDEKKLKSKD